MSASTPDELLKALRDIGVSTFPYRDSEHEYRDPAKLDALYAAYAHALADFVDGWRIESDYGYYGAATIVHNLAHAFPPPPDVEAEVEKAHTLLVNWPEAMEVTYPPKENA